MYDIGFKPGNVPPPERQELLEKFMEGRVDLKMYELEEAFGTTDFTNALYDAAHVSAMQGYGMVEPTCTWQTRSQAVRNYEGLQ